MGALLLALAPLLAGMTQPIKDYFASKAQLATLSQQIELAKIQAEKDAIVSNNDVQAKQTAAFLQATTLSFRQGTFYFLLVPMILSIVAPEYASAMWSRFEAIPQWFQILFVSVYSVIWGLPIAKDYLGGMFSSLGRAVADRREYKLEVKRIDMKKVFDSLRADMKGGISQETVDMINRAVARGQE